MAEANGHRKKPVGALIAFGIMAVCIYFALYAFEDSVNQYFTRGGVYAFLPIAAAFLVSYAHGNFTGHFWTVLGVEASQKKRGGR